MRHFLVVTIEAVLVLLLIRTPGFEGLSLPSTFKVDRNGKPRIAVLVGKAIGVGARVGLCARTAKEISIDVEAESNRAVICGNLKEVAIRVKHSKGPILNISELDIHGSELRLGWWPLIFTSLPFVLWRLRPSLFSILFYFGLYKLYSATPSYNNSQSETTQKPTLLRWIHERLDGYPCDLEYQLRLSEDDVNHSTLIKLGLNSVLRSLMLNSVLGEAAATADAFSMLSSNQSGQQKKIQQKRQPHNLLKPSDDCAVGANEPGQNMRSPKPIIKQERMLTKLLQATAFKLNKVTFSRGRMIWNADAVFPDDENQSRLSYVLRTKPEAMALGQDSTLGFANPECQFSLGATVGGPMGKFLPDLWLPVGPGIALSLGSNHRILRVEASEENCNIGGRVSIFRKERARLAQRIRENLQQLPPSSKNDNNPRRALKTHTDDTNR